MKTLPSARLENIIVQNVDKEVLIYDLLTNKAYSLNETSAIVYQNCDGKTAFDEIKRQYKFTDDLIYLALDELKKENLIETSDDNYFPGLARREAIRKVGLASMIVLPMISSLVAPTAAMAASTVACNSCTASLPLGSTTQFPIPVTPGDGISVTGCAAGCTRCRCTIPGGGSSCTSTCTVN